MIISSSDYLSSKISVSVFCDFLNTYNHQSISFALESVRFVVASFTGFNLIGLGILGACAAIFFIQLNPKYHKSMNQVAVANVSEDELEGL
jgi:mannose/fructose/N-acetylgalactosamine-specific phosphotransferase system component IIC